MAVIGRSYGNQPDHTYTAEEAEFALALERYKRLNRRPWPTCAEVLAVAKALGYRKTEPAGELPRYKDLRKADG